jgi:hypothetical protein
MLARLIDERHPEQLAGVEFTGREPVEPGFLFAREAAQARPRSVPLRHVDAIGTALAEQEDRHSRRVCSVRSRRTIGNCQFLVCRHGHSPPEN